MRGSGQGREGKGRQGTVRTQGRLSLYPLTDITPSKYGLLWLILSPSLPLLREVPGEQREEIVPSACASTWVGDWYHGGTRTQRESGPGHLQMSTITPTQVYTSFVLSFISSCSWALVYSLWLGLVRIRTLFFN